MNVSQTMKSVEDAISCSFSGFRARFNGIKNARRKLIPWPNKNLNRASPQISILNLDPTKSLRISLEIYQSEGFTNSLINYKEERFIHSTEFDWELIKFYSSALLSGFANFQCFSTLQFYLGYFLSTSILFRILRFKNISMYT
jgi:hypothetical protein